MVQGMRELIEEAETTNTPLLVIAMNVDRSTNQLERSLTE